MPPERCAHCAELIGENHDKTDFFAIFRGKEANKQLQKLFEEKEYAEVGRLFLPGVVVDRVLDLTDFWWKTWDIYWMFVIFRILLVLFFAGSGYVDEGEYFDAVESAAGDAFDIQVVRTEQESKKLHIINLSKQNLRSTRISMNHRSIDFKAKQNRKQQKVIRC